MRLLLVDDAVAGAWEPFALTRPAGEMRFGAFTASDRAHLLTGRSVHGHVAAPHLLGFEEPGAAPVVAAAELPLDEPLLLLNARVIPAWSAADTLHEVSAGEESGVLTVDGAPAAAFAYEPETRERLRAVAAEPDRWADAVAGFERVLEGVWLKHVWDIVSGSPEQCARDIEARAHSTGAQLPDAVHRIGDAPLFIEADVELEPGVVLDTRHGPIWLRRGSAVRAFSRVAGPTVVDPGSTLLGGPYDAVTVGPVCKIHGEVEETIVLGYSNKAHDGFLGHALVGRWVNLGALTTNSDLKNNYGPVRLALASGEVDTGLTKLGCFLGDHVKTGIGLMLNTGTIVGAGANLYGSVMPPKRVPAFSWGEGERLVAYAFDRFIDTARTVMARRDVELSDGMQAVLERAWQTSETERAGAS